MKKQGKITSKNLVSLGTQQPGFLMVKRVPQVDGIGIFIDHKEPAYGMDSQQKLFQRNTANLGAWLT